MIQVDNNRITVHKQNTVSFNVHFEGDDIPDDGTQVIFAVSRIPKYGDAVIQKTFAVQNGVMWVDLRQSDTEDIPAGHYYWNLIILYDNGTAPWTVFEDALPFEVLPELGGTPYELLS